MTSLPTLTRLGTTLPPKLSENAQALAQEWFQTFSEYLQNADVNGIISLLVDDVWWRDMLALTWDFRTFQGTQAIQTFLSDRLALAKIQKGSLKFKEASLQQPYPDLAWVQGFFTFETDVGIGSGIFRLVPTKSANGILWKAHAIFTNLEDLKGFPEQIGSLRDYKPNHGKWSEKRRKETAYEDRDPTVLIVGGGQGGLGVAARLKALGVSTLVIDKQPRIGDQWRNRYEALCLHDPVWYDHMPYLPFPPTWPVYTPARKLADWLESYAHSLELDVWTSSTVTHATQDEATKKWTVVVKTTDKERVFKVNHVVFALGLGGSEPNIPKYPGMELFEGEIKHSSEHHKALDHKGKKVVVIGACTSGHDISADYYEHGVDVTLFQRGPTYIMTTKEGMPRFLGSLYSETAPPTDVADRLNASFPNYLTKFLHQRVVKSVAEADRDILEGLKKRGFKLTKGLDDSGFLLLAWERGGGYYLDVGASQLIIDGKIKLKNDSPIAAFTKTGLKFENDSELPADVVLFATGYADAREPLRRICGDAIADRCKRIWGLNEEGELNGVWRDLGIPNLWYMIGNLALGRFHSKHIALQIKAIEEGVFGTRYSKD